MNAQMREMKTMLPAQMPRSPGLSDMEGHSSFDRDQYDLARLGKKQVLKVDFAFFKLSCGNTTESCCSSGISLSCLCWASAVP